jgi:hypothetical protein
MSTATTGPPSGAQFGAPDSLKLVEDLRIRSSDTVAGAALTTPSFVVSFPNANVFVGDLGDRGVRQYDPRGRFVRRFGQRGDGPQDFGGMQPAGKLSDTLWIFDRANNRVALYSSNGEFIRTSAMGPAEARRVSTLVGLLPSGLHVMRYQYRSGAVFVGYDSVVYAIERPDDASRLASFSIPAPFRSPTRRLSVRGRPIPLSDPFYSPPEGGAYHGGFLIVGAASYWHRNSADLRIIGVSASGSVSVKDVVLDKVSVTSADLEYFARRMLPTAARVNGFTTAAESSAFISEYVDSAVGPTVFPGMKSAHVGDDGCVWAQGIRNDSLWTAFTGSGERIGVFPLPSRMLVLQVRCREVWGSVLDSLGAPSIVRYSLRSSS